MPEEDRANLCSVKLVMLNMIITHVEQNDHPAVDTDTMCHDYSFRAFYFLSHNKGAGPALI